MFIWCSCYVVNVVGLLPCPLPTAALEVCAQGLDCGRHERIMAIKIFNFDCSVADFKFAVPMADFNYKVDCVVHVLM